MTASPRREGITRSGEGVGVVVRAPRRWLGLEGLVLLAGALIAFSVLGQPWWLVPAGILVWSEWVFWLLIVVLLTAAVLTTEP